MSFGLTVQQQRALAFISDTLEGTGIAPTFDDIKAAVGISSKSGVHRLMTALEDRGHIHRIHKRARAIALGPAPTIKCPHCQQPIEVSA